MSDLLVQCICGQQMRVLASAMGTSGKCPLCGRVLKVTEENARPLAAAWLALYLVPKDWTGYGEQFGPFWPFSNRWCIAPAMFLSTGLCYLTFLLFYAVVEIRGYQFPHLSVLGENPLVVYLLQYALMEMNKTYVPESSTVLIAVAGFVCMCLFCYFAAKRLHDQEVIIKL